MTKREGRYHRRKREERWEAYTKRMGIVKFPHLVYGNTVHYKKLSAWDQ